MPILDIQRRVATIGHIRLGERGRDGFPRALKGFRFTTPRSELATAVASAYGGTPERWENPATKINEWQVVSEADAITVLLPPADVAFSQHYELWSQAGCERRCDGFTEYKGAEPQPCICAAEHDKRCQSVTRLSLVLPDVAHIFGVWRLVTQSYYASGELQSAMELALAMAARRGEHLAQATLRLEQRVTKQRGEAPHRFPVPVLDVWLDLGALGGSSTQSPEPLSAPLSPAELERAHAGTEPPESPQDGPGALSVVDLPEPAPKIDRGAPSPSPHPLSDEGARAPSLTLSPEPSASEATEPEGNAAPSGSVAPLRDDHERTQRYLFATMHKLWPRESKEQIDERRACLAILVSHKGTAVSSWKELSTAQLYAIGNRLKDIEQSHMSMEPIVGGYVYTLTLTGGNVRKLFVRKTESGAWEHWTQEREQLPNGRFDV